MRNDQRRWDKRFKGKAFALGKEANVFLRTHLRYLPRGRALDLATGEGRNAIFLAQHGYQVDAADLSKMGLAKASQFAREMGVRIRTILADLDTYPIEKERYDLIANFYFLNRKLIPKMKRGLKKGGVVIFETYVLGHRDLHLGGPTNPKYFLRPNELLTLFREFRILFYREGIFREGGRRKAIASLIAQKS